MDPAAVTTQWLWPNAIGVLPVAAIVWLACRWCIRRPATRHALWVAVLVCLLMPPVLGGVGASILSALRSESRSAQTPLAAEVPATAPATEPALSGRAAPEPATPVATPALSLTKQAEESIKPDVASRFAQLQPLVSADPPAQRAPTSGVPPRLRPEPSPARRATPGAGRPTAQPLSAPEPLAAPAQPAAPPAAEPSRVEPERVPLHVPAIVPPREPAPEPAAAEPPTQSEAPTQSWVRWREWFGHAADARAWLVSAPPLPAPIWLGGAAAVIAVVTLRTLRFRSVVSMAEAAPREVRRLVEDSARELGLREAPVALMVPDRVSPMVWCLGRTRLLLPRELWGELDDGGRRAVVYHELAHLRRRDHWVRWAELAASALFWWHPVLWWVRRRLRDEADLCCDAWVTALLPKERRAYAQALLCTQVFLSRSDRTAPAVGLGVMSAAAGRLARRLTMVMKERSRPNVSLLGVALAVSLVGAGMTASPLWACPPEDKEKAKLEREAIVGARAAEREALAAARTAEREAMAAARQAEREALAAARAAEQDARAAVAPKPSKPPKAPKPPKPPKAPKPPKPATAVMPGEPAPEAATTFEEHIRARAQAEIEAARAQGEAGRAAPRPDADDDRIEQINRRLDRIERRLEQLINSRQGQRGAGVFPIETGAVSVLSLDEGPVVSQVYALPEGKLSALTALMARADVPVRISREKGGIRVMATPHQHEVFRLFVHMIHPEDAGAGQGGRSVELAATFGSPVPEEVALATELDIAALVEAVRAIDVEAEVEEAAAEAIEAQMEALEEQLEAIEADAEAFEEVAAIAVGGGSADARARSESLRVQATRLHDQLTALAREAERAFARAETVRARGDDMKAKVCEKFCGNGKEESCPVCRSAGDEHEHTHGQDRNHEHVHVHSQKAGD